MPLSASSGGSSEDGYDSHDRGVDGGVAERGQYGEAAVRALRAEVLYGVRAIRKSALGRDPDTTKQLRTRYGRALGFDTSSYYARTCLCGDSPLVVALYDPYRSLVAMAGFSGAPKTTATGPRRKMKEVGLSTLLFGDCVTNDASARLVVERIFDELRRGLAWRVRVKLACFVNGQVFPVGAGAYGEDDAPPAFADEAFFASAGFSRQQTQNELDLVNVLKRRVVMTRTLTRYDDVGWLISLRAHLDREDPVVYASGDLASAVAFAASVCPDGPFRAVVRCLGGHG